MDSASAFFPSFPKPAAEPHRVKAFVFLRVVGLLEGFGLKISGLLPLDGSFRYIGLRFPKPVSVFCDYQLLSANLDCRRTPTLVQHDLFSKIKISSSHAMEDLCRLAPGVTSKVLVRRMWGPVRRYAHVVGLKWF